MNLWAIVPVKPLHRGKSRLAGVLNEGERYSLNIALLIRTLEVLKRVEGISQTAVVSRDPAALAIAADSGVEIVNEEGESGLNAALMHATSVILDCAPDGIVILPADLPLIQPADIETFIYTRNNPPVVVVAPDRHESGTNALMVRPAGLIEYSFGVGSFKQHCRSTHEAGAHLEICRIPSLALDLDLPEDLEILQDMEMDLPGIKLPSIISN